MIKIFARLELKQKWAFKKGLNLQEPPLPQGHMKTGQQEIQHEPPS